MPEFDRVSCLLLSASDRIQSSRVPGQALSRVPNINEVIFFLVLHSNKPTTKLRLPTHLPIMTIETRPYYTILAFVEDICPVLEVFWLRCLASQIAQ